MTMREIGTVKGVPHFVLDTSGDEDSDTEYLTSHPPSQEDHIEVVLFHCTKPRNRVRLWLFVVKVHEDSDIEHLTNRDSSPLQEEPNDVHLYPDDSSDGDVPIDLIAPYSNPIPHEDHVHVMIYRRKNSQGRITVKLVAGLNILPRYRAKRARLYGPP